MKKVFLSLIIIVFCTLIFFVIFADDKYPEYPKLKGRIIVKMPFGNKIGQAEIFEETGEGPSSLGIDEKGNIYIADGKRIQIFSREGKIIRVIKLDEYGDDISINKGRIYISTSESIVMLYDTIGNIIEKVNVPVEQNSVFCLLSDEDGNFYVNSYGNNIGGRYNKWYKFDENFKMTNKTYDAYDLGLSGKNTYVISKDISKRTNLSIMINDRVKEKCRDNGILSFSLAEAKKITFLDVSQKLFSLLESELYFSNPI